MLSKDKYMVSTKLKCKPCREFYPDDGSYTKCEWCGGDLRRIRVHGIDPEPIAMETKSRLRSVKDDKHKKR